MSESAEPAPKRRLSLTKTQRHTAAGAELLSLCQTATEDGSLSDEEIAGLFEWLKDNKETDLPAIVFLTETVESILSDGRVTKEERNALYSAVEAILPLDVRKGAVSNRRAVEREEQNSKRREREALRQKAAEERERNRPAGSWNFMVAGVRYENRPTLIRQFVEEGDPAFLIRDRSNGFSRNAIEVRVRNGVQVGYVPEDYASEISPLLDQGYRHEAYFTKLLTAGRSPIPVVQTYLYRPDAVVEGALLETEVPDKNPSAPSTSVVEYAKDIWEATPSGRSSSAAPPPIDAFNFDPPEGAAKQSGCLTFLIPLVLALFLGSTLWAFTG